MVKEDVVDETGGARDARYVPEVDEYEGRYEEGVMEEYFGAVALLDDNDVPSVPY